jgi:DNA gyrase subunit A
MVPYDGDVTNEDLIAREDVVVTVTRTGYAKRTKTDLYRAQRAAAGRAGRRAADRRHRRALLRQLDPRLDPVLHQQGPGLPGQGLRAARANRNARGQHVANLLAFQPDETIAQVIAISNYEVAPYLVLATKQGLVKKTKLTDFDSNRAGGVIAINLREDDELIDAALVSAEDDLLLISVRAMSIRFKADDDALRPMGRATSGVFGMRFNAGDELLAMEVIRDETLEILGSGGPASTAADHGRAPDESA